MNLVKDEIALDCHPGERSKEEKHITVTKNYTNPCIVVYCLRMSLNDDQN